MALIDVTDKIERFEALEERAGVVLAGLSGVLDGENKDWIRFDLCGELHAVNGMELKKMKFLQLVVAIYDLEGRVVKKGFENFDPRGFYGIEIFEVNMDRLPSTEKAEIVRVKLRKEKLFRLDFAAKWVGSYKFCFEVEDVR